MTTRRKVSAVLLSVAALFVAAQFKPVERKNPPADGEIRAPADVQLVLDRCCFDCHSNGTRWPWYAYVAPASWLVADDVKAGRHNLNFSYWERLSPADRRGMARQIIQEVSEGEMPLAKYLLIHRAAKPSAAEIELLRTWFSAEGGGAAPATREKPWVGGDGGGDDED